MERATSGSGLNQCGRGSGVTRRTKAEIKAASNRDRRRAGKLLATMVVENPAGFVPRRVRRLQCA